MRLKTVSVLALSGLMCMGGVVIANVKKNNCKDAACYCKWVIKQCVSKCKYYYKHKRGGIGNPARRANLPVINVAQIFVVK